MDDGIPFKAFLYMEEGSKAEVRRFNIDKMFYGKIRPLTSKVRDVFPKLKAKNFTLAWKDEDDDEVLMSSDEEVETMYQQSHDSVLKLIVRCTGGPKTDDDETPEIAADANTARTDPQAIHQGITCDGCGRAVVGFRYKCITCDDFDLCIWCENAGKHPEHCVVRVPVPNMSLPLIKATIKKSRRFLKSVASQAHEESKKLRRERAHSKRSSEGATAQGKQDSQPRASRNWVSIFGSYLEEFTNLAGDLGRHADTDESGAAKPAENETKIPTSDEISVNPWNLPQKDLEKLHHACKFMRENALRASVEPLTKAFSKVLAIAATAAEEATALSPARASSPIRAMTVLRCHKDASPEQAEKPKEANVLAASAMEKKVKGVQMTLENFGIAQEKPKAGQNAPKSKEEAPKDEQTLKDVNDKDEAPIEPVASTSKQNQANVPAVSSGATKVVLPKEFTLQDMAELIDAVAAAKAEIASNASTCSSNGSVKAEEWTVIDNPNDEAKKDLLTGQFDEAQNKMGDMLKPEGVDETTRRVAAIYPKLNAATAVLDPKDVAHIASAPEMPKPEAKTVLNGEPNKRRLDGLTAEKRNKKEDIQSTAPIDRSMLAPHIAAAVTQMESMGFSNQSEWLTQLLIHEDGNISAVLDLITPHTPRPK